jgi:hypothetical protein
MFTVTIPCKPYVRHFLVTKHCDPANLAPDRHLNNLFRRMLKKPCSRYDKYYQDLLQSPGTYYSCTIEIIISESDFYRYGWELTKTDVVAFNGEIEGRVKQLMRSQVELFENIMTQKEAILRFQEIFGFTEDVWPYESIKKDYYRSVVPNKFNIREEMIRFISEKLSQKHLDILSLKKDNITANT